MKVSLLILLLTLSFHSLAQFDAIAREQELAVLLDSLRASQKNDRKEFWNKQFKTLVEQTLHEPGIFEITFPKLKTLGVIDSPDKLVRIVNWNVEQDDGSQKYYAYVLHKEIKKGEHTVIELIDNSMMLPGKPEETLEANRWYGALYYQIIPVEKSNKTYYTLLGWDGGTRMSNTKLIDVLYFSGNSLKLGYPLFKSADKTAKRIFYEHSEKTVMSLRYEPEYNRIIFDHLMPETPTMAGFYEFYVPDMSYDAFILEGSRWVLKEDVIGVNKGTQTVSVSQYDVKKGEVSTYTIENKWIDPTEGSGAGKNDVHVAVLPDSETKNTTEESKKAVKKDPKEMTALQIYESKKKHKKEKSSFYATRYSKNKKAKK